MDRFMSSKPNLFLEGYPLPLRLHAGLLLGLGLGLTFAPGFVVGNPLFRKFESLLGLPSYQVKETKAEKAAAAQSGKPSVAQTTCTSLSTTGLLAFGLGLSYIGTASLPGVTPETNQLVYGAVPLRILMVVAAATKWIIDPASRDAFKLVVIVEDAIGTAWLVWLMRSWKGWNA